MTVEGIGNIYVLTAFNGNKSCEALSGGRYNLKHFVTVIPDLFAHNAFQRFQHGCGWVRGVSGYDALAGRRYAEAL